MTELDIITRERNDYLDWYFIESQKVLNLRKILKEIKDIATYCMKQDICTTCDNSDRCYIEDEEIPAYDVCKLIIQKISEVDDG